MKDVLDVDGLADVDSCGRGQLVRRLSEHRQHELDLLSLAERLLQQGRSP